MGNNVRITYRGEVLATIDPTQVKSVEPYVYCIYKPQNLKQRIVAGLRKFFTGRITDFEGDRFTYTKVSFRDGTFIKIRMPFYDFINEYC